MISILAAETVLDPKRIEDGFIQGAIDLHAHGYPEVSLEFKGRVTDPEWAEAALRLRMGGFVIKSHLWPTMERAYALQMEFPAVKIFGSLTLNPPVGGLSPWAVESAVQLGAKVLWFPTWGARFDIEHHGGKYFRRHLPFYQELTPEKGITLVNPSGTLKKEVQEIIGIAQKADLIVGTGHISPGETLKLAEYCKSVGFKKLIFTHPLSLGASLQEIEQVAGMGFYIELTCLHILLQVVKVSQVIEVIRKIGDHRCLLATDAFFSWTPPAPEMLRLFAGLLHYHGLDSEAIRQMVYQNPRELLGLNE